MLPSIPRNIYYFLEGQSQKLSRNIFNIFRRFPANFAKFLRTPFFYRTSLVAASESGRNYETFKNHGQAELVIST